MSDDEKRLVLKETPRDSEGWVVQPGLTYITSMLQREQGKGKLLLCTAGGIKSYIDRVTKQKTADKDTELPNKEMPTEDLD